MPCCTSPHLKKIFSRRAGRYFHKCQSCGKAFADEGGQPAELPLRGDPDPSMLCPDCASPMVRVHGAANGDFWSCSRFPKCKGVQDIDSVNNNEESA